MIVEWAAALFAALTSLAVFVQIALVFGAPWGVLTMGGRWPGVMPPAARVLSFFQTVLLITLAGTVLAEAGLLGAKPPQWMVWGTGVITSLSAVANTVTPSLPERRLWAPVTILMVFCFGIVLVF
ncbi:MAG: hypothetical protein ACSHXD_05665 [Marinosulfonomonas sp.]